MWHWDQGHLPYFQFDSIRKIASLVIQRDFKSFSRPELLAATGLGFPAPAGYTPWRNYGRAMKLCLLVSEIDKVVVPTDAAQILAQPGSVTCDEYFHFLIRSFTEPAPALKDWRHDSPLRYPLLFSLKYLLLKVATGKALVSTRNEIIGAYFLSKFDGSEDKESFVELISKSAESEAIAVEFSNDDKNADLLRQTNESLKVIAQISYLHAKQSDLIASISPEDAWDIFVDLTPISGPRELERNQEIQRLGKLFVSGGYSDISFEFPHTAVEDAVESGFSEGNRVKRTHITIERNAALRREFFLIRPTSVCDVCTLDTASTYPWTERIIDLHHLLPLSSGTAVSEQGTKLDDLVPVCPSCHRAIHRFYDNWLRNEQRKDFVDGLEAKATYDRMKSEFPGVQYA